MDTLGKKYGRTVGMPHVADKFHRGWGERVVLGELELGGEEAAFKGRLFGALDERFPDEHVVFGDGAGGDALGRVVGEVLVLLEEALGCDGRAHCG